MYEDVVRSLRKIIKAHKEIYGGSTEESVAIEQAADAIEELQAGEKKFLRNISALETENENLKRARRWIPVTERLPEKNGKYLCNIKRFGQYAENQYYYVDVLVFQEDSFFEDGIGTERVTHWMPLPTPPEEEET